MGSNDKDINKIKLATILSQAMIQKIKDENLIEDIVEYSDDLEGFFKTVFGIFGIALIPLTMDFATKNTDDMDEEEIEELNKYKEIFNILKGE